MNIVKKERHENELAIFSQRSEGGVRAVHQWLLTRREEVNTRWPGLMGEDLTRLQGEAGLIARMVKLIEQGPTIKEATNG